MNQSLNLIDQLIWMEQERDRAWKNLMITLGHGSKALGDSSILQNLRNLRELVIAERNEMDEQLAKAYKR